MKYPEILSVVPAVRETSYDEDDTALYALAVGAGASPQDLPFVYEKELRALPTMAAQLDLFSWDYIRGGELTYDRIVHGEQRLTLHQPMPPRIRVTASSRCLSVIDRGANRGAMVNLECTIRDTQSSTLYATSIMSMFCRGDGGFGGPTEGQLPIHVPPTRPFDHECALPTLPQQAALFRLLGDKNPLHIDPQLAQAAGFPGPVLHGLCTYGIACRAIVATCCNNDPTAIERFDVRFSAPFYPGETLLTRIWVDGQDLSFECHSSERQAKVISNGYCRLRTRVR